MRVLVANRGEIAGRVLATLARLGIDSVAVYTPADAGAPYLARAGRVAPLADDGGYLDPGALLAAARATGATAVHPGYGFLSQSAAFAAAVAAANLVWVGPSPAALAALGDKRAARALAAAAGVAVIPGAAQCDDPAAAAAAAAAVGYPVLLKAAGGGGGRGMRRVAAAAALPAAFAAASREAAAAFGDGRLLLERLVTPARHVEVQVLGDGRRAVAVGTRECSLQRRYQKVVEEAPALALPADLAARLADAAVRVTLAAELAGAGTVEFLLDAAGRPVFLEVNPRLQVEHAVTEMCTGVDLVAAQLAIAHGAGLPAIPPARGHAIEVRLYAEDPARSFLPATGEILALALPHLPNVRVDCGIAVGQAVTPQYDPLLAKLVAWGPDREAARTALAQALQETVVLGVVTNQRYLAELLAQPWFVAGHYDTARLEAEAWTAPPPPVDVAAIAATARRAAAAASAPGGAAAAADGDWVSPWDRLRGFRVA